MVFNPSSKECTFFGNSKFHEHIKCLCSVISGYFLKGFAFIKFLSDIISQLQWIILSITNIKEVVGVFCIWL